jgi:hypothetical protein
MLQLLPLPCQLLLMLITNVCIPTAAQDWSLNPLAVLTQGMQSSMTGYRFATLIAISASMPCRMLQLLLQVRSSPWATLLQKKKSCSDMLPTQKHKHDEQSDALHCKGTVLLSYAEFQEAK